MEQVIELEAIWTMLPGAFQLLAIIVAGSIPAGMIVRVFRGALV